MINITPSPILFSFNDIQIHYYGLIFVFAIIVSMLIIKTITKNTWLRRSGASATCLPDRQVPRQEIEYDYAKIEDLYFYLLIFGIIGARLYSVFFFYWDYYKYNLLDILKIWQGGIAIQGAIISGIITMIIYCKIKKINTLKYLDLFALVMPLAQSIGRWGNFFNGELYGKASNLPWAIYIKETGMYHHPVFFYESVLDLILFFILLKLFKKKSFDSQIILAYLMGYGIIRFFMEFIRIDSSSIILGINFPQIISLIFILFSSYFLFCRRRQIDC